MSTQRQRPPWYDRHLWSIQPVRDLLIIAIVIGILYLGSVLSIVTVPLLLAVLLAYLFEPIIRRISGIDRVSRRVASAAVIAIAVLVVVVPLLIGIAYGGLQAVSLARSVGENATLLSEVVASDGEDPTVDDLPRRGGWRFAANELIEMRAIASERDRLKDQLEQQQSEEAPDSSNIQDTDVPNELGQDADLGSVEAADGEGSGADVSDPADEELQPVERKLENAERAAMLLDAYERSVDWLREHAALISQRAVSATGDAVAVAFGIIKATGVLGFQAFLTAFFFFFVSSGFGKLQDLGTHLIPADKRDRVLDLLVKMDRVIAGFVRGRLTIAAIQSVFFAIGYFTIGAPAALLLGIGVGVLSIVPYLALLGIPVSIALMALDGPTGFRAAWWWIVFAPIVVYQLGQMLDDYVLTPWIQGKSTDLDTPTVLFASIAGGALAGVYGLLVAIPIAACLKILVREIFWPRYVEWVEGTKRDPLPLNNASENDH